MLLTRIHSPLDSCAHTCGNCPSRLTSGCFGTWTLLFGGENSQISRGQLGHLIKKWLTCLQVWSLQPDYLDIVVRPKIKGQRSCTIFVPTVWDTVWGKPSFLKPPVTRVFLWFCWSQFCLRVAGCPSPPWSLESGIHIGSNGMCEPWVAAKGYPLVMTVTVRHGSHGP